MSVCIALSSARVEFPCPGMNEGSSGMRRRTMTGALTLGLCLFATQVFAQETTDPRVRITNSAHGPLTVGCSGGTTWETALPHGSTSGTFPCSGQFRVQRAQGCATDTSEQTFSSGCSSSQFQTTTVTADDCESALSLSHTCETPSYGVSASGGPQ